MLQAKLIRHIAFTLSIVIFSGLNLAANSAQRAGLSVSNHGSAPDEHVDDKDVITHAAHLWRSLALSYGMARHNYGDPDPLGRVDPLVSETGFTPTTQATLRWRGKLAQALPEIALQSAL